VLSIDVADSWGSMMFSMWARFAFESSLLGFEAQRVMLLRMIAMAAGGSRAHAEAQG
jgi:hypothetical protein